MMAEKRGIDRCVLKLINAYEYGVYSEVEADNFKKDKNVLKDMTDEQKGHIINLILHQSDDIKSKTNAWLKEKHTQAQAKKMIKKLESMNYDGAIYESLLKTCMEKLKLDKTDAVLKLNEFSHVDYSCETFDKLSIDSAIQLQDEIILGTHG